MADLSYGYRYGRRQIVRLPVAASSVITAGDFVQNSSGYVAVAAAGTLPVGVAVQTVTGGSSAGDVFCEVDISLESTYAYPPDSGTATEALRHTTMDLGGAQSIDIDASTDDCVAVVDVDTDNNLVLVQIVRTFAGVV